MKWDEILRQYRELCPSDAANDAGGFLVYLKDNYRDPTPSKLCRIWAAGKTYDWRHAIANAAGGVFTWHGAPVKKWIAEVPDEKIDEIRAELNGATHGEVRIEIDPDSRTAPKVRERPPQVSETPPPEEKPGARYSYTSPQGPPGEDDLPF